MLNHELIMNFNTLSEHIKSYLIDSDSFQVIEILKIKILKTSI